MVLLTGGSGLLPGEGVRARGSLLADGGGAVMGVGKGNSGEDAVSCRRTQEGQFLLLDRAGGRKWLQTRWGPCKRPPHTTTSGSKAPGWVASAHFPNQIESELLLFLGSWKHRELLQKQAGCSLPEGLPWWLRQ